eukprot:3619044-Amphidinium_carterae.1
MASWRKVGLGNYGMRFVRGFQYFDFPVVKQPVERLQVNDCNVKPIEMTFGGFKYPVELVEEWNKLDELITKKSAIYADAVRNAQQPEDNMTEAYRALRNTMDGRLYEIFTQPNYGRGVPVVICGSEVSGPTIDLLAHRVQNFERDDLHKHNLSVLQLSN